MIPVPFLITKISYYQKVSEAQKGSSMICFGSVRQKHVDGQPWYPHSLLALKTFDTRMFPKLRRLPFRTVLVLRDIKSSTKNSDTHYPTLLSKNKFDNRFFSRTQKGSLQRFLLLWNNKKPTENRDTPHSFPIHKNFRYRKLSKTLHKSSMKSFGTVRHKTFNRKSWWSPLRQIFFHYLKSVKHWRKV